MNAEPSPADHLLSIDELDRNIVGLSALINTSRYELLVLIRQFDERAGWLKWGLSNCAEWLHWRCDLSMSAARENVRVARIDNEEALLANTGVRRRMLVRTAGRRPGRGCECVSYW